MPFIGRLKNPAWWVSDSAESHSGTFRVNVHGSAQAGTKLTSATLTG